MGLQLFNGLRRALDHSLSTAGVARHEVREVHLPLRCGVECELERSLGQLRAVYADDDLPENDAGIAASSPTPRTTTTVQAACMATLVLVEPRSSPAKPPRPREPTLITSTETEIVDRHAVFAREPAEAAAEGQSGDTGRRVDPHRCG